MQILALFQLHIYLSERKWSVFWVVCEKMRLFFQSHILFTGHLCDHALVFASLAIHFPCFPVFWLRFWKFCSLCFPTVRIPVKYEKFLFAVLVLSVVDTQGCVGTCPPLIFLQRIYFWSFSKTRDARHFNSHSDFF